MMPAIVAAGVSPGTATISNPTEQIAVIASSFASEIAPDWAARIMLMSSETGMKEPDSPPTEPQAIRPPFFTASFNSAKAAVVPGAPTWDRPISSKMAATESPTAEVGASDRSMIPKRTPSRSATVWPTNCPMRVIWKAARLMTSAHSSKGRPRTVRKARSTTPGPETPTLNTTSGSFTPWKAPAMKGLSPTALAKTTSFAAPKPPRSAVAQAHSRTTEPICATAAMLMPVRVEATFTEAHTISVTPSAAGRDSIRAWSVAVRPLSTSAEYPPMKSTPTSLAARSKTWANCSIPPGLCTPEAAATSAMGVTEMRLFVTGTPYSAATSSATATSRPACRVIFS